MQIQEGAEHQRNFPRLRTGAGGWLGFVGGGGGGLGESGETPPTSFSSLLRPTLGERPHGQRRDGQPRREEPGKVRAAVIRRERQREGTTTKICVF